MKFDNLEVGGRKFKSLYGEIKCPEYMLRMIMINIPGNILPFSLIEKGSDTKLIYETDTKTPIKDYLLENGADEQWMKNFLLSVILDLVIA